MSNLASPRQRREGGYLDFGSLRMFLEIKRLSSSGRSDPEVLSIEFYDFNLEGNHLMS